MADTTFIDTTANTQGTPIVSAWLNDINDHVYNDTPISPVTTVHDISKIANSIRRVVNVAAIRAITPVTTYDVETQGYYTAGDGGHGTYYGKTGAALGTYIDDGFLTIVPTGGDGSSAWKLRVSSAIDVKQAGAVGGGVDDTAAIQTVLNTGVDTLISNGIFKVTSSLTMSNARQRLFGFGFASQLYFQLSASSPAIILSGSIGNQSITDVYLNGVANVSKVCSVGSPQVRIHGCRISNATTTGHGVYCEDENIGAGIYAFGLDMKSCSISGPGNTTTGTYGIRTGTNSQSSKIKDNVFTNWSTHFYLNGATTQLLVQGNVFENCSNSEQAIYINRTGSAMPCYEISIINNYFEQNHVCITLDDCAPVGLNISGNYAYRNTTATKATSYFYYTGLNTSASAQNLIFNNNYISDFGVFLGLANQYASRIISAKGNTLSTVISYSSGSFANLAYKIKTVAPMYSYMLEAGTVISNNNLRLESLNGTINVPVPLSVHESLHSVDFYTIANGANTVTATLYKSQINGITQTSLGSVTTAGTGTYSIPVTDGYVVEDGYYYFLRFVFNGGGVSSFLYPARLYLYE